MLAGGGVPGLLVLAELLEAVRCMIECLGRFLNRLGSPIRRDRSLLRRFQGLGGGFFRAGRRLLGFGGGSFGLFGLLLLGRTTSGDRHREHQDRTPRGQTAHYEPLVQNFPRAQAADTT